MINFINKVLEAYFNILYKVGYKNYSEVYKVITISYIQELLTDASYMATISQEEKNKINALLQCIYGSSCMLPMPSNPHFLD